MGPSRTMGVDKPNFSVLWSSPLEQYLPARASEQGNVIGLVSIYIYIYVIKKNLQLSELGI